MLLTCDFETAWSADYSLTKLSETDYIKDPRFEPIMCSLKVGNGETRVAVGDRIAPCLAAIDWKSTTLLSHNVRFDGAILAWHYGHVPAFYLDTLSMSRATTHWTIGRSSLARVAEYLGLPAKGDEVLKAKGKWLADFTDDELETYKRYCARDTDLCHAIFTKMRPLFRTSELSLIDMIARMFITPQVKLNETVLQQNLERVLAAKAEALAKVASVSRETFSSQPKFAALLEEHGVEVPLKVSPTTGQEIPALAKGDWAFKELCADDTLPPFVQALLAARVSEKSTLEETRSRNMLALARKKWRHGTGWAPVPLKYSGARTHRLSGDGGSNWQNLTRGSLLKTAIEAPDGWRIVHRDSSQIEARMTAWMAKCDTLTDAFAEGRDVYSEFASLVYEREITKADTLERFVGKTAILGLGYGCGRDKFRKMLFIGNGGISLKVDNEAADVIVGNYRALYHEIPALWSYVNFLLKQIVKLTRRVTYSRPPYGVDYSHIPVEIEYDSFLLPNGLKICYPELRQQDTDLSLMYTDPNYTAPRYIYGAKGVENISQALARIIVTDIAVRMRVRTGYTPFLSTHDSLDYCVPATDAEAIDTELERQFAMVPEWGEGLPLASEGGWGKNLTLAERRDNS
jgi:DNA polymerase family A